MAWVRNPFFLGPTLGKTELERGLELAIGAPNTTYRSASKFHQAFRRARGSVYEPERPGPKPGQPRRTPSKRELFERFLLERTRQGVTVYYITQDAEAQRLYREVRGDHAVVLNEQAVRRVLRKHRNSPNSS